MGKILRWTKIISFTIYIQFFGRVLCSTFANVIFCSRPRNKQPSDDVPRTVPCPHKVRETYFKCLYPNDNSYTGNITNVIVIILLGWHCCWCMSSFASQYKIKCDIPVFIITQSAIIGNIGTGPSIHPSSHTPPWWRCIFFIFGTTMRYHGLLIEFGSVLNLSKYGNFLINI